MEEPVLAILTNVVDYMEKNGAPRSAVTFGIGEDTVNGIYEATGKQYSLEELFKAADKCIAHEWIQRRALGQHYECLAITEKGVGIVRSTHLQALAKKNRKPLKKLSDWVEDHKGLMAVLGFFVALATLSAKLFWGK